MTRLSIDQQLERFGVTFAEAHKIRNRAESALSPKQLADARKAWQDLSYELRGNKGQPWQAPGHPERVRFTMLSALADGANLGEAVAKARATAWESAA